MFPAFGNLLYEGNQSGSYSLTLNLNVATLTK
jgi:hypothetical protein